MSKVVVDLEASRRKKTTIGELIVSQAKFNFLVVFSLSLVDRNIYLFFVPHDISAN
jgi:hypothetical protein